MTSLFESLTLEKTPMNEHQDLAICALHRMADHLLYEKAKAFQLNPQKPEGKDPQSVIEDYLNQDQRIRSSITWVKNQIPTLDLPMNEGALWSEDQLLQLTRARFWLTEIWQQMVQAIHVASSTFGDEDLIKEFIANVAQRLLVNLDDPYIAQRRLSIDRLIVKELADCFPPPALSLSPSPSSSMTTH